MLRKMEVNDDDEEEIESFVSQIYQRCLRISGLTSDDIGWYLKDLVEFSDEDDGNDGNPIKLSEISYYIEQKKNKKRKIKKDIQNL